MIDWGRLGFDLIGEAYDGEDALKLMEEHRPDLVITDIRMPVIDGLAFLEQASGQYPRTKFILLSGYADFEYARQASRFGVSNYLTKPLDDKELECAVEAAADAIRLEDTERRRQQTAAEHIREETLVRLLLGDTRVERVRSTRQHLGWGELSRFRCIQLLPGQDESLQTAWLHPGRIEGAALVPELAEVEMIPFRITRDYQGFLLASGSAGPVLSLELVNRVIAAHRSMAGETLGYAVSNEHRGPLSLHRAYQEAVAAGIFRLPSSERGVYVFQDKLLKRPSLIPAELKRSILQALASGNPDGVTHYAKAFFTAASVNHISAAWTEAYLSTVKLEALKALMEHGADADEWTQRWFAAAPQQHQGESKCRWVKELVEAAEWIRAGQGVRTDATIHAALAYIKLRYADKLLLQHVADHVHLNPAYLGQRFKRQLGMSFHEYLHAVRIEESKKLLRRADLKIADIAARVGYSDTDQFAAKFKAVTGMLPSAYKKG